MEILWQKVESRIDGERETEKNVNGETEKCILMQEAWGARELIPVGRQWCGMQL